VNIVSQEFEKLKQELIASYDAKGMRASGEFATSLEVRETERGAQLWGAGHAVQLEYGRGTTKSSGGGDIPLREKMVQWIHDKGIQPVDISVESLAFLIARKIHREGWNRAGRGGVGLISGIITDERINEIIEKYKQSINAEYVAVIQDKIRQI
jgi:hypothetical protein